MNDWDNTDLPSELQDVASRLRENRNTGSPMELDELKQRAMSRAARASRPRGRKSPRLVTAFLLAGLTLSGASAGVVASTSGSSGGQRSAAISQYEQLVAGERILPGSAKLLAPTGCVAKAFNARVSGQNVAKVVFLLDGKKIKTLTTPNAGARFQVRVNPAKLRIGVHRIVANVTFTAATKKAAKSYRISFQRCPSRLAAPQFTG
jgi:hypothetical protein